MTMCLTEKREAYWGVRWFPILLQGVSCLPRQETPRWNDESAKGEEPFGKKIGSSAPYDEIVDVITKEVLKHLKGGQN